MNEKFQMFSKGLESAGDRNSASVIVFLVIFVLFITLLILYNYLKKKYNFQLIKKSNVKKGTFVSLAKSVGLNSDEIKALYDLMIVQNVKYPLTCFTNSKMLDEVLKKGLHSIEKNSRLLEKDKIYNSYLLLETKGKIENSLKKNIGIKSTHLISERQKIVLFFRSIGYFYSTVIRNSKDQLTIELVSEKINRRLFKKGEFVKCYLWREEDAGYTFETEILGYAEDIRTYYLKHSDNLVRSQSRKYRRIPVNFIAEVFPVYLRTENNKKVFSLGTISSKGSIVNLSAGGLKIRADGIDGKEKYLKVSFDIGQYKINIIGKIVRLYQSDGVKEATLQFAKVSLKDRNYINTYVYNYFPGYD